MSKKQIAAIVAAVVTLVGALATGVAGLTSAGSQSERIRVVEVRYEGIKERLDRIEDKLDQALRVK